MSSIFAITSASDTAKLDAAGKGEMPFTASNSSGRQLRGRAEVRAPGDPAKQSYLKIDGEAERDFPKDGVQQFTVHIQAPPGVQEAKFSFRLDVLSVTNPDEDFTQGPTVSVVIPMLQKDRKPFPWWIVAAAVAVLAIVGVGVWLFTGRTTTVSVPDVSSTKSLSLEEAKAQLAKVNLKVAPPSLVPGDSKYINKVVGQVPTPGTKQDPSKLVSLQVGAKDMQVVPDVSSTKSMSLEDARVRLGEFGLKVGTPSLVLGDPKYIGKVIGQDPPPGTEQESKMPVILQVGAKGIQIPGDLTCKSSEAATNELGGLGLIAKLVDPAGRGVAIMASSAILSESSRMNRIQLEPSAQAPPDPQHTVVSVEGQGSFVKPGDTVVLHLGPLCPR